MSSKLTNTSNMSMDVMHLCHLQKRNEVSQMNREDIYIKKEQKQSQVEPQLLQQWGHQKFLVWKLYVNLEIICEFEFDYFVTEFKNLISCINLI